MLETKIEALTKAIEALTAAMQSTKQEIKELSEQTIEPTIVVEPVDVESKPLNHADLRDAILKANRSNSENKVLIKEMLTKYKATKVSDVAEQDIEALINDIEGLCK